MSHSRCDWSTEWKFLRLLNSKHVSVEIEATMFQLQALFVIFLAISSAAWGRVLPDLPQELSEFTGLSEAQLKRLILPEHALRPRATNCSTNDTSGGVFPGPRNPSASDLIKRNSFVKRSVLRIGALFSSQPGNWNLAIQVSERNYNSLERTFVWSGLIFTG